MAGNIQADNSGNILVEFDYNNIIVVDPNKTIDDFGNVSERLVDHENLVMYANLETQALPRTKMAVGASPNSSGIQTISVAKMNFLRPTKETFLSTGYYDTLTGQNTTEKKGTNQPLEIAEKTLEGEKPYYTQTVQNSEDVVDQGLLGITSIQVTTNTSFVPNVRIELEDVQGKALFQLGENSPYSAFFNLPYPIFYLTLKGYYGQAIRYQLQLKDFTCRFNTFSGNYQISLQFFGYKFNILSEISMGHLLATPHMYPSTFTLTNIPETLQTSNNGQQSQNKVQSAGATEASNSQTGVAKKIVTERGYQKIVEVYSEYKAKGLIPPNFPELTLVQLMNNLENFEKNIISSYPKANLEPLTNIREYTKTLTEYFNKIRSENPQSWFVKNLDPKPIVTKNNLRKYYTFIENFSVEQRSKSESELAGLIKEYNSKLASNATLGDGKPDKLVNPITPNMLITSWDISQIDWLETAKAQLGIPSPTDAQVQQVRIKYPSLNLPQFEVTDEGELTNIRVSLFVFEGTNKYDKSIANLTAQANKKLSDYEAKITADLARKLEDSATGIGFKPTVRNMVAVIMASAEAFIRLLDDVHVTAWNVKYDPVRKNAILNNPSSAKSSDDVDNVKRGEIIYYENNDLSRNAQNSQIPVYPWPQYFEETNDDKKGRFQLKYVGDPSCADRTGAWDYSKWPEVEFVEEYMRGLNQKLNPPLAPEPLDTEANTKEININAIEFPQSGVAYINKEELKFFYEIWERQFVSSHYSGFNRAIDAQREDISNLNVEIETSNIVNEIALNAPMLTFNLKNYDWNAQNFLGGLEALSNSGTGKSWQTFIRDGYVTSYLRVDTDTPFSITNTTNLGKTPLVNPDLKAFEGLIKKAPNKPLIVDTLPFTDYEWNSQNLALSSRAKDEAVYSVADTLKIFKERNLIANFDDLNNYTTNRPVTNFSYLTTPSNPTPANNGNLSIFYSGRTSRQESFIPTESYITAIPPSGSPIPFSSTTSILNTPFLVNAIQSGVGKQKNNEKYPYVSAAYLFINSLPLATLRERYKSNFGEKYNLDYIATCFNKYGAIHKVPYAWILKMGSIWHRYKTFKQSGTDILSDVWKDFNFKGNYDPIQSALTKTYEFTYEKQPISITAEKTSGQTLTQEVGFYPKLISDFNYFYNTIDLFGTGYTNTEIQESIDLGIKIFNYGSSNFYAISDGKLVHQKTWSVILPEMGINQPADPCEPTTSLQYFICPSFGSTLNQTVPELVQPTIPIPTSKYKISENKSVFNGSIRCLWAAPNYGYFDVSQAIKPNIDSYMWAVNTGATQYPFAILNSQGYSTIEEIFSVFEKSQLDTMETMFLNFARAENNSQETIQVTSYNQPSADIDAQFKNFQTLFKTLMTVEGKTTEPSFENYFNQLFDYQLTNFNNIIKNFMEYDLLIRNGNPTKYRRRVFDSFISYQSDPIVQDPLPFKPYVPNSLPDSSGLITLSSSRARYPKQWRALELEVGFSTITDVVYTDVGSTITDFFIDCNIEFSEINIEVLAPLIKMYATQKQKDSNYSLEDFQGDLQTYLEDQERLQNQILNNLLTRLRKALPTTEESQQRSILSVVQGQQSKVENWEVFKSLNDKWISGADWKEKTLFEDFLFLDRASRNIGEVILIDIFSLKNTFNKESVNMNMSVYTFIASMLINNNFTVMNLPAYVNFYNIQEIDKSTLNSKSEGSLEFANSLWGTFLDVDYRKASPKMVCFYVGRPSEYLEMGKMSRYRSDALEMRRTSDNPLIENQKGKSDWGVSNRCVGFNVDIGIRNQNIFYSFSVSQDAGKATSESLNAQLQMMNQGGGKNFATQNVSLYNLYKNRSYQCNVVCLGNALLQPMMYFNLRHVPMFNGPYLIQQVEHSIQPGSFQTTITGTRQAIFDLPSIDNYLQSVNQNLLTKLQELVKVDKTQTPAAKTTEQQKAAAIVDSGKNTKATPNSCVAKLNPTYTQPPAAYVEKTDIAQTRVFPKDFAVELNAQIPNLPYVRAAIYCICYIRSFVNNSGSSGSFNSWGHNYATITLEDDYNPGTSYFERTYSCTNLSFSNKTTNASTPIAHFKSFKEFISFMKSRLVNQNERLQSNFVEFYVCNWPKQNVSPNYFNENPKEFEKYKKIFDKALKSAQDAGVITLQEGKVSSVNSELSACQKCLAECKKQGNGDRYCNSQCKDICKNTKTTSTTTGTSTSTTNPTTTATIACPPPTDVVFSPIIGSNETRITVTGNSLDNIISIQLLGETIPLKDITIIPGGKELTFFPKTPTNTSITSSTIILKTQNGQTVTTGTFRYSPTSTGNAAQPNVTTQQTPSPSPVPNNDKFAFEECRVRINGNYVLNIRLNGNTITGSFGITLPLQNQHPATVYLLAKTGTKIKIADFTIANNNATPPNRGSFTSNPDNMWQIVLEEAMSGEDNLLTFYVDVPDVNLKFPYTASFLTYSCPGEGYDNPQIIDVDEYKDIRQNPCCACYPNGTGGRRRIIDGKQCNETSNPC